VATAPSKITERVIGWLIPPACREEVLGDLRERCADGGGFLAEAMHVIPFVVVSRIRRTSDAVMLLMEGITLYTCFVLAAWWLNRTLLYDQWGFVRLAIPPAVMLLTQMLADAYSDPRKRSPLRPMLAPVLGIALVFGMQSMPPEWTLPRSILSWGGGMGVLLIATLRMLIPPIADRPRTAQGPAFWEKLELAPMKDLVRWLLIAVILLLAAVSGLQLTLK
jgi:hypothetical protein